MQHVIVCIVFSLSGLFATAVPVDKWTLHVHKKCNNLKTQKDSHIRQIGKTDDQLLQQKTNIPQLWNKEVSFELLTPHVTFSTSYSTKVLMNSLFLCFASNTFYHSLHPKDLKRTLTKEQDLKEISIFNSSHHHRHTSHHTSSHLASHS